ncbi:MAG: esterase-like activity of phytase family protein [Pseudomonadota bacterium]
MQPIASLQALPGFPRLLALASLISMALAACGGADPEATVGSLRLIGEQRIALKQNFNNSVVGGLSGIDYDPVSGNWIMISDDKSDLSPARYYTAKLTYDQNAFSAVALTDVTYFKQADGSYYPNKVQFAANGGVGAVVDPESIRFDPKDRSIWWTSEGDRTLNLQPFVRHIQADGTLATLPTPAMFSVSPTQTKGSRLNLSYEAMTFSADGESLWMALEGPTYEDGTPPTASAGALTRISRYDRAGKMLAQYAYNLSAVPGAPAAGGAAENGVSEMLAINSHQFLLLERGVVQGAAGLQFLLRIYEIDTDGATDVSSLPSLAGASVTPVGKRLVLDLNQAGLPKVDCIEGISWGPTLPNGNRSIVLVSDDNFDAFGVKQVTQLLAFEVLPK